VQSQPNRLSLLPALPESWRRGTLRGVRARGGVIVERLDWDENGLDVTLLAAPGSSAAREGDLVDVTGPDDTTVVLDLSQGPVAAHISRSETNR
jgi:alpha-L-fucosidase 2